MNDSAAIRCLKAISQTPVPTINYIVLLCAGSKTRTVDKSSPHYNTCHDCTQEEVRSLVHWLIAEGYIERKGSVLEITKKGAAVLLG